MWDILENHKVVIPTFQRDYAQGRAGKEELRKKFLNQIHTALEGKKELLLDFVYGTKIDGVIYPLDGQQRLTTIWTLMWYATLKNKDEETSKKRLERLRKFTYETRESSKDFMTWLCDENTISYLRSENNSTENEIRLLSDSIQMHSGFNLGWNQDPTVQSILRILSGTYTKKKQNKKEEIIPNNDGIEQVFKEDYGYLEKLFEESLVKFYHLDLVGIKQPDNLYVKMNARGEQLTGFENFKADLIEEFLKDDVLKKYVTPEYNEYILTKWDIYWTDIFWQQRKEQNSVDDMFFTFIKRFLLNRYNANYQNKDGNEENKNNKGKDKIYTLLFENEQEEYTSYNHYKELIDKDCIDELTILLDNIANCNCIDELKTLLDNIEDPKCFEEQIPLLSTKKYAFLPQYENSNKEKSDSSIKSYSFQERVVMYGICLYLQHAKIDKDNIDSFKHWLRVLSNLAYYKELPTYPSYRTRLKFIKELVDKLKSDDGFLDIYSDNAVKYLKSLNISNNGDDEVNDNKKQLQEEIRKIGIINDDKNKNAEEILEKLESLWIFSGNIDCLLDNNLFNNDNIYDTIEKYIGGPTTFLRGNNNLITLFQAILAKTEDKDLKDVEVMKFNDEHDGLRKLLNGALKVPLQKVLKDNIDTIYNNDDWKYALIKDKRLWNYAAKGILKKDDNGKHYLYKGTYKNDADILLEGYNAFIRQNNIEQSTTTQIEFKDKKWYIDNQVIENWEKYLTTNTLTDN